MMGTKTGTMTGRVSAKKPNLANKANKANEANKEKRGARVIVPTTISDALDLSPVIKYIRVLKKRRPDLDSMFLEKLRRESTTKAEAQRMVAEHLRLEFQ